MEINVSIKSKEILEQFLEEKKIHKGTNNYKVLMAFLIHGKLTDYHIEKLLKINSNSSRPARINLVKKGMLKSTGEKMKIRNRRNYGLWELKDHLLILAHNEINKKIKSGNFKMEI